MNELIDEHTYLEYCICSNYRRQMKEFLFPVYRQRQEAASEGDYSLANILDTKAQIIKLRLVEQKIRAEDILRWLRIDSLLRKTGATYPDILEGRLDT